MKNINKNFIQHIQDNYGESSEEYFEQAAPLIGKIIIEFNSLEAMLNSTICEMLNERTDLLGAVIIKKLSYSQKVDLFKDLCLAEISVFKEDILPGQKNNKDIPILKKLVEDLQIAGRFRNTIAHSDWESADEDGFVYYCLQFTKAGLVQEYKLLSLETLQQVIDHINSTKASFDVFDEELQILRYC